MVGLRLDRLRDRVTLCAALWACIGAGAADAEAQAPFGPSAYAPAATAPQYGPPAYAPSTGPQFPASTSGLPNTPPSATAAPVNGLPYTGPPPSNLPYTGPPPAEQNTMAPYVLPAPPGQPGIGVQPSRAITGSPLVLQVVVEGMHKRTYGSLPRLGTRSGEPYDPQIVEDDVKKMIKSRKFVDVYPRVQPVPGGVVVIFQVVERPVITEIKFVGCQDFLISTVQGKTDLKIGDGMDPYSIKEARDKIEAFYRDKGYERAHVTVVEGVNPGDTRVVFLIDEGVCRQVFWTSFVGNTFVDGRRLRTQLVTSRAILWLFSGHFERKKLDEDVEKLTAYYRAFGFFQAKIGYEFDVSEKNWVHITYVINEGPRYKVHNVTYVGAVRFGPDRFAKDAKLKAGDYFDQGAMSKDLTMVRDLYGGKGYVFADIQADPRFLEQPAQLDLIYNIKEGLRYRVGRININVMGDSTHTHWRTIYDRLGFYPGEIIDTRKVRDAERRLKASGIFAHDPGKEPKIAFGKGPNGEDEKEIAEKPRKPGWMGGGAGAAGGGSGSSSDPFGPASVSGAGSSYRGQAPDETADGDGLCDVNVSCELANPTEPIPATPAPAAQTPAQPSAQPTSDDAPVIRGESPDDEPIVRGQEPAAGGYDPMPADPDSAGVTRGQAPTYPPAATYPPAGAAPPPNVGTQYPSTQYPGTPYSSPQYAPPGQYPPAQYSAPPPAGSPYPGAVPAGSAPYAQPGSVAGAAAPYDPYANPYPQPQRQAYYQAPNTQAVAAGTLPPGFDPANPNFTVMPALDPRINVYETQTGKFMVGVGVNSDAGLVGNIVLDEQNFSLTRWPSSWNDFADGTAFRGDGQRLRLEASPGTELQRYVISFQEPYLFDEPVSFMDSVSYFNRIYNNWTETRVSGRVGLGYYFTPDLSGNIGLRAERVKIGDYTGPDEPNGQPVPEVEQVLGWNELYGVSLGFSHDTRDSPFLPDAGHLLKFNFEQVFGSYQYPIETLTARQYFNVGERPDGSGKQILSIGGEFGVAGPNTPLYDRFYAGGFSSLRGFEFYGVSPVDDTVQIGGDFEALGTIEYMFPITAGDELRGVVFTDFGEVEPSVELKGSDFRCAPGIGLRITIPALGPAPLALDLAFPVHKMQGDITQVFSFSIDVVR